MDTVGFISNLPHELVESFKSTLSEILHARLILHVIDVSNPKNAYQKNTVYKVLKEVFGKNNEMEDKIIEAWNKIDLVTSEKKFFNEEDIAQSPYPIVPVSAKTHKNINILLDEIEKKLMVELNKENRELSVAYEEHEKLTTWLKK